MLDAGDVEMLGEGTDDFRKDAATAAIFLKNGQPYEAGDRLVQRLKEQGDVSIIIIAHNYGQVLDVCDRVNLIQGGQITFDRRSEETSAQELTEIVVAEYRKALEERQRAS